MVARIRTGKSIKGAINYNEHKVRNNLAALLMAQGYAKDTADLSFRDKVIRLEKLAALNQRATTNCLHISLNFDPSEKPDRDQLIDIAKSYMTRIGFDKQPYLVYQHHDAAHPHIHIVTTNIQKNGSRISMHNLGKIQSEKARKEIEKEFGLVRANDGQNKLTDLLRPVNIQRAVYGRTETKRSISNIVTSIVNSYKYTSLAELNAVLNLYNVTAYRGEKNSRMYTSNGLQYSLINDVGKRLGVPIKASSIAGKPTLKLLEARFANNEEKRKPYKSTLIQSIENVLTHYPKPDRRNFQLALKQKGIDAVFRTNETGLVYGVTFVDHNNKTVFKGSDLGKAYSAAALGSRLQTTLSQNLELMQNREAKGGSSFHPRAKTVFDAGKPLPVLTCVLLSDILRIVADPSPQFSYTPAAFRKRKKKKRNIRI